MGLNKRMSALLTAALAVSLASATVPGASAVTGDDPPPPPNTLTRAAYLQSNGNDGTINLVTPGKGSAAWFRAARRSW